MSVILPFKSFSSEMGVALNQVWFGGNSLALSFEKILL